MLEFLLRMAARLPLRWLHAMGTAAGWATYQFSRRFSSRISQNLQVSGLIPADAIARARMERAVAAEIGKGVFELIPVWFRPPEKAAALVVACPAWESIERLRASGRGLLFLTPHLGCFEVSALYAAMRLPITVLYRPPKLSWLEPIMRKARTRGSGRLAPTSISGVRRLLKALRAGEAIGVLPDHVPGFGEGEWAPFFGRPAYTMTLAGRLQKATGCAVIVAFGRRLPRGGGYVLELELLDDSICGPGGVARLNRSIENLIRRCPEQYLWSYNRFKVPAGVAPPRLEVDQ